MDRQASLSNEMLAVVRTRKVHGKGKVGCAFTV
jgi:hypothetical protein